MKTALIAITLCLSAGLAAAGTINVPADKSTIQAAVDDAVTGDTVLVAPGLYYENITLIGQDIVLASRFIQSANPTDIDATIIDGSHLTQGDSLGSVISILSGETIATRIVGFTIQGGIGTKSKGEYTFFGRRGAGILIEHASATVISNVFTRNTLFGNYCQGAGISIKWSNSIVRNNRFVENYIDGINYSRGAAVYLELTTSTVVAHNMMTRNAGEVITLLDATGIIDSNQISHNVGIAIFMSNPVTSPVAIRGNDIRNNTGVGIYANYIDFVAEGNVLAGNAGGVECRACGADLLNNTVANNHSSQPGGGFYKYWDQTDVNLAYNIFWNNSSIGGGPELYFQENAVVTANANDVRYGQDSVFTGPGVTVNWGAGNISLDPMFCTDSAGDYTISAKSPCMPANDSAMLIGALGIGCGRLCGDVNFDGQVNRDDLMEYVAYYFLFSGRAADYPTMDLDCDGKLGLADILKLAAYVNLLIPSPCCGPGEMNTFDWTN